MMTTMRSDLQTAVRLPICPADGCVRWCVRWCVRDESDESDEGDEGDEVDEGDEGDESNEGDEVDESDDVKMEAMVSVGTLISSRWAR